MNTDNVGAERMSSGRLIQATGPATQNARLPSCSPVLGTTKSPRAAEWRSVRSMTRAVAYVLTVIVASRNCY